MPFAIFEQRLPFLLGLIPWRTITPVDSEEEASLQATARGEKLVEVVDTFKKAEQVASEVNEETLVDLSFLWD